MTATEGVEPVPYARLDPGIRELVYALRAHDFRTTDSGDGVSKPDAGRTFDFPHVFMVVDPDALVSEARRLYDLLPVLGCTGWQVEAHYAPADGIGVIALMEVPDAR